MHSTTHIRNTTRSTPPRISYEEIKNDLLGKSFELSLVFIGDTRAKRLNKELRNKTYNPNVLTLPLSKQSGEMFINLRQAKKEAGAYGVSHKAWVLRLFIHGLLHLEGHQHGATMEHTEEKLVKKYL